VDALSFTLIAAKVKDIHLGNGEGGIRTLGTLLGYGALAKRCFRPLSHLTKISLRRQYCSIEQRLLDLPERGREYGG
jgi:hypothetical protein